MPELTAVYSVVLRENIPPLERELLGHYCCRITSERGGELLYFMCTEVDVFHAQYIRMETFRPGEDMTVPLQIPHWLVLLISGADARAPIGFVANQPG
jgi:hypothetical protein